MHPIGERIIRLEEVASTNTLVLEREDYLASPGLVVLARHQTGGRGTTGRTWASVPGRQLQFTVVVHPRLPAGDVPVVALVTGLAVARAIREVTGLEPRLKWPNDVLVAGRKACGILLESKPDAHNAPRLVVGIGINCNGAAEDFPPELRETLTTLAAETGNEVDTEALLAAVLRHLERGCARLEEGGKAALLDEWRAVALLGPDWRIRVPAPPGGAAEEAQGYPEDVSEEGYLIVRLPDGRRVTQVSGRLDWVRQGPLEA